MNNRNLALDIIRTMPGGEHYIPILDVADRVAVGWLMPSGRPLPDPPSGRGSVVVFSDDGRTSYGPAPFHEKSVKRHLSGVHMVAIMSGAADILVYQAAASAAVAGMRVVLVETTVRHEGDWWALVKKLAPRASTLLVTPPVAGRA